MDDARHGRPAGKPAPWLSVTGRELKLALVAALGSVYLALWPQLTRPSADGAGAADGADGAQIAVARPTTPTGPVSTTVWVDTLPPAERPVVVLPEGWRLATPEAASTAGTSTVGPAAPRVAARSRAAPVRVAATRRPRVRTRSS